MNVAEWMMDALDATAIPGPDVTTVRESRESADDGFAALVERQTRFVFRVAFAILRNVHDAEDTVQETFLRIYRANAWLRMENEEAFLARTAWRIAVDRLPRRRAGELGVDAQIPSSADDPERAAIDADWSVTIQRLMDALPEQLRQPLALSAIDELSSRRIAEIMGIPEGTVRTRILRARKHLKERLSALMEAKHGR